MVPAPRPFALPIAGITDHIPLARDKGYDIARRCICADIIICAVRENWGYLIAAGASDYVTKPVDNDDLLARMDRCLSRSLRPGRPWRGVSGRSQQAPRYAATVRFCAATSARRLRRRSRRRSSGVVPPQMPYI